MPAEDWAMVQRLADERLVVTDRDPVSHDTETAQVAHEALIQGWSKLRDWVAANRNFLSWRQQAREATELWEQSDRDDGDLLRGLRLSEARRWCSQPAGDIDDCVLEFVRESRRAEAGDLIVRAGNHLSRGMLDEAIVCYGNASSAYGELGDRDRWLETLRLLIWLHFKSDERRRGMSRYREALELVGPQDARLKELTEMMLGLIAELPYPLSEYRMALAMHRRIGDRHGEARICNCLASSSAHGDW